MHFWVPVVATVGAAAMVVWVDALIARRKRAKAAREAVQGFRQVLAGVIAQFDAHDAYNVMTEGKPKHDAAIAEFRRSLASTQVEGYDALAEELDRCRAALLPARARVLESLQSGRPADNTDVHNMRSALDALLSYAASAHRQ